MTQTLRNISDSFIRQQSPATNYGGTQALRLCDATGQHEYAYLLASGLPSAPNAVIDAAFLEFYSVATQSSHTITARRVLAKWSASTLKWSNAPSGSPDDTASQTQAAVLGTLWSLDVTAIVRAWVAGTPNYGFRLETTSTVERWIASANAAGTMAAFKPTLRISWSAPPSPPDGFVATDGAQVSVALPTLPWSFSDPAGLAMAAYQFQSNPTDSWGAPAYDSGEKASSVPQHKLTSSIADGATLFYRARNKNTAGKWSAWSDGQEFGRTVKPTLTIDEPSAGVVGNYSPTYAWTLAGTQTGFVADTLDPVSLKVLDASGDRAGTDNDYETAKLPVRSGGSARLRLRVRDDVDRVTTPGDPVYIEAVEDFTVEPSLSVDPVTSLAVAQATDAPFSVVSWSAAVAPDSFIAERRLDGGDAWVPFPLDLGDVALGGGDYSWSDVSAPPRHELEYRVRAVVNGEMGDAPDTDTITLEPIFIWLVDPLDPSWVLPLAGKDAGSWGMGEQSSILEVRGSDRVNLVHEGFRGYEGSISGSFHSGLPRVGGATAVELRDRAWRLKSEPTKTWRLVLSDMNIPVVVRNVVVTPTPDAELNWVGSLEFYQQGELPWV